MTEYAYVRVSTKEQNIDRQIKALEQFHIRTEHIFCDYQSGRNFERPEYGRLKQQLTKGDLLIVKSIDRLGRNYNDIIKEWREITQEIGADIKVIDMELLDTRGKGKDLTGAFISDLVLQILAYVAETERNFIRERQAEGISIAKARGVKFGREKKKLPANYREVLKMINDGKLTIDKGIQILGISKSTYYRRLYKRKKQIIS